MARYIFLSPHLDDAALSCGGIVHNLSRANQPVEIWTIFAGNPPPGNLSSFAESLHNRWELSRDAVKARRKEDLTANQILGASSLHFHYPDCIYRFSKESKPIIESEEDLFKPIPSSQLFLVDEIAGSIIKKINPGDILVSPASIGGHLDHRIVRKAVTKVMNRIFFYQDYPYVESDQKKVSNPIKKDWQKEHFSLSCNDLQSWKRSIIAHKSQLSTFWKDTSELENAIDNYFFRGGGRYLWRKA